MRDAPTLPFALTLALSLVGCALPTTGEAVGAEDEETPGRVFGVDGVFELEPTSPSFSFVVDVDGPQVVVATGWGEGPTIGEARWARPAWLTEELALAKDVDPYAVPVDILVRQGEPFVTYTESGETCVGYLGELSVVRMITQGNVAELAGEDLVGEDGYEALWDYERVGPPEAPALSDTGVMWELAEHRTYLVARLEVDDPCTPGHWGAHPEATPTRFAPMSAGRYEAEAQRLFRAHPDYARMQRDYDATRDDEAEYGAPEDWPAGPWDTDHFVATAFEAPDGRRLVIASADRGHDCSYLSVSLTVLFEVANDGSLRFSKTLTFVPDDLETLVEDRDGRLEFVTPDRLITLDDVDVLADVAPLDIGCGC